MGLKVVIHMHEAVELHSEAFQVNVSIEQRIYEHAEGINQPLLSRISFSCVGRSRAYSCNENACALHGIRCMPVSDSRKSWDWHMSVRKATKMLFRKETGPVHA